MIQKIFQITVTIFCILFIVFIGLGTFLLWQTSQVVNDIKQNVSQLTKDDVNRILNILEQQVENNRMEYENQFSVLFGSAGYIPDTFTLKYLPSVGWVVTTNETIQRLEGWIKDHPNLSDVKP